MNKLMKGVAITAAVLAGGAALAVATESYTERSVVTATVTSKDRVCSNTDSGSSCKYLIFTDQGTFQVSDSMLIGRWSSSDTYGKFREDRTYEFEVYGWRLPVWSAYPNVASEPVEVDR